jgi:Tfp pilus assembly protein PilP
MKSVITLISALLFIIVSVAGCSDSKPPKRADKKPVKSVKKPETGTKIGGAEPVLQDTDKESGYVYEQRERRDPFDPLIKPTKKTDKKGGTRVTGTLESYDITVFTLAAIIKKQREFIALLVAPDNRSFSVRKGDVIGLNKGKVEHISGNEVVLSESSPDYKGELKFKRVTLELKKGEGE